MFLFSGSKASDANVGIIANFVYYGKTRKLLYFPKKAQRLDELTYSSFPIIHKVDNIDI